MTETNDIKDDRGNRKAYIGVVTSDKMEKTITVRVDRLVKHGVFGKYMRRKTVLKAHDEKEEASTGDRVEIVESRAFSRTKRFRLVRVLEKARNTAPDFIQEA